MLLALLDALKTDVATATGLQVHVSPEGVRGPCAIVYPRNPWLTTPETWDTNQVNLGVQLVASAGTNRWVLDELGAMVDDLLENLDGRWIIEQVSGVLVGQANGAQHQLITVNIATTTD